MHGKSILQQTHTSFLSIYYPNWLKEKSNTLLNFVICLITVIPLLSSEGTALLSVVVNALLSIDVGTVCLNIVQCVNWHDSLVQG